MAAQVDYNNNNNDDDDDDEYFIPLQDQRVFGAGLKRKRIQFVPSTSLSTSGTTPATTTTTAAERNKPTAGSIYASIVLPTGNGVTSAPVGPDITNEDETSEPSSPSHGGQVARDNLCEVCHLPLSTASSSCPSDQTSATTTTTTTNQKPHEATLAHQACLTHSHPPSHLDRRHKGLQYLSSYGWDPDGRLGLGAKGGEGRLFPVKPTMKNDTWGVGFKLPKGNKVVKKEEEKKKLGAKQMRKRHEEERRKAKRLQDMFYQSEEVVRYLGTEG
ncbi:MAG: hypothetical protein M1816_001387 [Peltula sp. TS41687]|nr:MAG: hypothetical protein M1816_001387 [Peltula sp. TS41687]